MTSEPLRRLEPLTREESVALLASTSLGRVVFTDRALPAIRPVNHIVDGDYVIIRSHLGSAITSAVAGRTGTVVAYEADAIDPVRHLGWSVVLTGIARLVTSIDEIERYEALVRPWVNQAMTSVIRISADIVNGFRLIEEVPPVNGHPPAGAAEALPSLPVVAPLRRP